METFRELVNILSKQKWSHIIRLPRYVKGKDLYTRLYVEMREGNCNSKESIAEFLEVDPDSSHYRIHKTRFSNRLINTLLLAEIEGKNKYIIKCHRNNYSINLLFFLGARNTGIALAKKTLKLAVKYEEYDISINCVINLRYHFALLGNKKKFQQYKTLFSTYNSLSQAEKKVIEYSDELEIEFMSSNHFKPELIAAANECASKIGEILKENKSYKIYIYYYRVLGWANYLSQDYKNALTGWIEFEQVLENYVHMGVKVRLGESRFQQLGCYLHLKDYDKGRECAEKCKESFNDGTHTWFFFMEYYFLLSIHTAHYSQALEIFTEVTTHARYPFLIDVRKERWQIFGAYLAFLLRAGELDEPEEMPQGLKNFRLSRFINETLTYSKDKRGYNVAILIAQILHLMHEGKLGELIDKTDALKRYSHRYLKKNATYRSNLFINMIVAAGQAGFETDIAEEKTAKLYSQLKAARMVYTGDLDSMEIIPFEDLWEKILHYLKSRPAISA